MVVLVLVVGTGPVVVVDEENQGMTAGPTEGKEIVNVNVNVNETGMDDHLDTTRTEIVIEGIVVPGIGRGTAEIRIAAKRGIGIDNETENENEVGRGIGGMRAGIVIEGRLAIGISTDGGREFRVPGSVEGRR